jgi:hypothetical protein
MALRAVINSRVRDLVLFIGPSLTGRFNAAEARAWPRIR